MRLFCCFQAKVFLIDDSCHFNIIGSNSVRGPLLLYQHHRIKMWSCHLQDEAALLKGKPVLLQGEHSILQDEPSPFHGEPPHTSKIASTAPDRAYPPPGWASAAPGRGFVVQQKEICFIPASSTKGIRTY
jgi:hypothetical protein